MTDESTPADSTDQPWDGAEEDDDAIGSPSTIELELDDDLDDGVLADGLSYECSEWSGESRSLLDSMLTTNGIRHSWQGTTLGVARSAEDRVDAIIDEVLATATPSLEAGRDRVVYEVGTWSAALQTSLAESLVVADIPYEWDENGDLVVYGEDEERVEEILDAMPDPDDEELSSADGVAVQDLLSKLWTAAGHLAKKPSDADSVVAAAEISAELELLALPFGFEPAAWRKLVAMAVTLREQLTEEDPEHQVSDDTLIETATALRDLVRHYV